MVIVPCTTNNDDDVRAELLQAGIALLLRRHPCRIWSLVN